MYHIGKHSTTAPRDLALAKLHDLELVDARDRLLLAGLVGRHPRGAYAEHLAGIEARLDREGR